MPPRKFNALEHGLFRDFATGDQINHAAWLRACSTGEFVGTCRICADHLVPRYPDEIEGVPRTDYEAYCKGAEHPFVAPGGRLLRRSGRHTEMPAGWWDQRNAEMKRIKEGR